MTALDTWLKSQSSRCAGCGFAPVQGCRCAPVAPEPTGAITAEEWAVFTSALRSAAVDGLISQTDMRPLIRGRIYHKHIGLAYRRAKESGLIELVTKEPSTDLAGGNTDKDQKVWKLRTAA